jgi:kynurenine formamidase
MDTSNLTVLLLMVGVLVRVAILLTAAWFIVPRRQICPHCREPTLLLVTSPWVRRLRLERRWCLCGWQGLSRRVVIRGPRTSEVGVSARLMTALVCASGLGLTACAAAGDPVAALFEDGARWIDLSHGFGAETIYWPTAESFKLDTVAQGMTEAGYYYSAYSFAAAEHGGTHLDAPVHFAKGRESADQIPLSALIGPAVVVDVAAKSEADPDYLVGVADFQRFEEAHGEIPRESIVLIRTGWGARWDDRQAYLGTDRTGPDAVAELHFPGLAPEAARWLLSRNIKAVGIDTPSIDRGQSTLFESHRILYAQNIPGFENIANLELMPETGAYVVALPMKIEGGSGGPLRIVGVLPAI